MVHLQSIFVLGDVPLLYNAGPRGLFALTVQAIASVMAFQKLRYIAFSGVEADECGALNHFLEVAPNAEPLCGDIAAMVSVSDLADRPPRALAEGETIDLGHHSVTWIATPHLAHAWEYCHHYESNTNTLSAGTCLPSLAPIIRQ